MATATSNHIVGMTSGNGKVGHAIGGKKGWMVYIGDKTVYVSNRGSAERELTKAGAAHFIGVA